LAGHGTDNSSICCTTALGRTNLMTFQDKKLLELDADWSADRTTHKIKNVEIRIIGIGKMARSKSSAAAS
jgi:hypothetical protein